MSGSKPTIYLLYGDDHLAVGEIIDTLRDRIGESSVADMNTARFSAQHLDLPEFETICSTMPFLAERRMIILEDAEYITRKTPWLEKFLDVLEACPEQTAVVIHVFVDTSDRRSLDNFQKRSPIFHWIQEHPETSWSRSCLIPQKRAFDQWIAQRARTYGGDMEPAAAHLLAEMTEGDPLLADLEILKLLDYADYSRPVTAVDVEILTPLHGQADIFTLVDAVGSQDITTALREFHMLQESVSLPVIFSMITRQFRLLIQARDCLDRNLDPSSELKGHSFVIQKITRQAKNFDQKQLHDIYERLLEIDYRSKSSSTDSMAILDSFIADLGSSARHR